MLNHITLQNMSKTSAEMPKLDPKVKQRIKVLNEKKIDKFNML